VTGLRQLPNVLTLLRLVLVAPIAVLILLGHSSMALALFVVAGASDALDGLLARRFGWQTELGLLLDPVADKLLVGVVFVCLAVVGLLPLWLAAAVIVRDGLILVFAFARRVASGGDTPRPLLAGKLNTLVLLAVVVFTLLPWESAAARATGLQGLHLLALASVVLSGVAYLVVFARGGADR
jgi:cardiolipin synthase